MSMRNIGLFIHFGKSITLFVRPFVWFFGNPTICKNDYYEVMGRQVRGDVYAFWFLVLSIGKKLKNINVDKMSEDRLGEFKRAWQETLKEK